MSVIPYNSQNKLVYHNPYTQVAIVLDHSNHTVRLLESPNRWAHRSASEYDSTSATCPQCGFDLRGFYEGHESKRRRSFGDPHFSPDFSDEIPKSRWDPDSSISKSSLAPASEYLGTLGGTHFMHRDYFKLLSGLNYDLRLAYPGGIESSEGTGGSREVDSRGRLLGSFGALSSGSFGALGSGSFGSLGSFAALDSFGDLSPSGALRLPGTLGLPGTSGASGGSSVFGVSGSSSGSDHRLPSDLFNQGYFARFFQKVPPFVLGSGAHAHVYKVQHVLQNIPLGLFAVKRINVGDHSKYLDHVLNEVLILYELSANGATANNLIRYNHVWMELGDMHDSSTFIVPPENSGIQQPARIPYVYILQQYCAGGNLETMITENFPQQEQMSVREQVERERRRRKKKGQGSQPLSHLPSSLWLSDLEIWKFFRDIANAVNYLHENKILHRDLKPSNCLLETVYNQPPSPPPKTFPDLGSLDEYLGSLPKVLVSDFGEGKFIDKSKNPEIRMGNTGTIEFADPKLWVYDSVKNYTHPFTYSCDMYSMGLIMCYVCAGRSPFSAHIQGLDDPEMVRSVISKWYEKLNKRDFFSWLESDSVRVRGEYTDCTQRMGALAYAMLKGEADSKTVLQELEKIKLEFLEKPVLEEKRENASVSYISIVPILNLVLLELLDSLHGFYVWKVLKVVNLAGLVWARDSNAMVYLLAFVLCTGSAHMMWNHQTNST